MYEYNLKQIDRVYIFLSYKHNAMGNHQKNLLVLKIQRVYSLDNGKLFFHKNEFMIKLIL